MSRRIEPGEIREAMIVRPIARTITAPPICYQQPRCAVIDIRWPYAVIKPWPRRGARDDVPHHRVHVDNLRRRDPAHHRQRPIRLGAVTGRWRQLHLF
ncbi:hypothetical protein [Actinoplanes regularis]|uniref:Uncharacterized protein n=1 Tax=Actinoplanes regularis TaxID=52697 RepID=A0A238XJ00_9ACTN|nr:hypothetical protein [Actinoplanes regularis]GIE90478.1 hypothetical protein Are01nite_69580 [Actinoplanes regularis]SNR58463.1 hypothetical protein SAMN06264365_103470 [Actinoplanes regularis]